MYLPEISGWSQSRDAQVEFLGLNKTFNVGETEFSSMMNISSEDYPALSPRKKRKSGELGIENADKILAVISKSKNYYIYATGTNELMFTWDGNTTPVILGTYENGDEYTWADKNTDVFIAKRGSAEDQYILDTKTDKLYPMNFSEFFEYEEGGSPVFTQSDGSYVIKWENAPNLVRNGDVVSISFPSGDSMGTVDSLPRDYRVVEVGTANKDRVAYAVVESITTDTHLGNAGFTTNMLISREGIRLDYVTSMNNRLYGVARYTKAAERKSYATLSFTPSTQLVDDKPRYYTITLQVGNYKDAIRLNGRLFTMTSSSASKFYSGHVQLVSFSPDGVATYTVSRDRMSADLQDNKNYDGDETYVFDFPEERVNTVFVSGADSAANWTNYDGTSLSSYFADVASDGDWTGIKAFDGAVWCFKEDRAYQVYGDVPPFGYNEILYTGIKSGSADSAHIIGGTMYYHSRDGVAAMSNGGFGIISDKLGEPLSNVKCSSAGKRLYVYGTQEGQNVLYVFDTEKGLWHQEEITSIDSFIKSGAALGFVCGNRVVSISGSLSNATVEEDAVSWYAESGDIGRYAANYKRLIKMSIRAKIPVNCEVVIDVSYDGGDYETVSRLSGNGIRSVTVFPKRCDHFKLRYRGTGDSKIILVTKTVEVGSDTK